MPKRKTNPTKVTSRLARVRVDADISQVKLADATGISVRTVQELERGTILNPGYAMLRRIAYALDVEIEEICNDEWLALHWWRRNDEGTEWEKMPVRKLIERPER